MAHAVALIVREETTVFHPRIGHMTGTAEIKTQVSEALARGDTVRLGRWTGFPLGGGRVLITKHSEESRYPFAPLLDPVVIGTACPEGQGAHTLVTHWLGDW
jgi:hypothetical protein